MKFENVLNRLKEERISFPEELKFPILEVSPIFESFRVEEMFSTPKLLPRDFIVELSLTKALKISSGLNPPNPPERWLTKTGRINGPGASKSRKKPHFGQLRSNISLDMLANLVDIFTPKDSDISVLRIQFRKALRSLLGKCSKEMLTENRDFFQRTFGDCAQHIFAGVSNDFELLALNHYLRSSEMLPTKIHDAYKAGVQPCGWRGDYPEGSLVVFWPYDEEPKFEE